MTKQPVAHSRHQQPILTWDADRIRVVRQAVKLSPERMAAVLNHFLDTPVSGRKIRRWEERSHVPSAVELAALCSAFHLDPATFFTRTTPK